MKLLSNISVMRSVLCIAVFVANSSVYAMDVTIETTDGTVLTGVLTGNVAIQAEFGQQEIPADRIAGIHGGHISSSGSGEWQPVFSLDGLFAAKGDESDKDGFVRVPETGGVIGTSNGRLGSLPIQNVTELEVEFFGAHFSGTPGSGFVRVEFLGDGGEVVASEYFDVANTINDWRIYKVRDKLQKYSSKVAVRGKTIADVRLFVNPGNWATVVRGLEIQALGSP